MAPVSSASRRHLSLLAGPSPLRDLGRNIASVRSRRPQAVRHGAYEYRRLADGGTMPDHRVPSQLTGMAAAQPSPAQMQPLYAAYQRRDLQAVVSLGSILVKRFPDATPLLNLLGAAYATLGQREEAASLLRHAAARLAALLQGRGELAEAIALYRRALDQQADPQTWFNLATAQRNAGLMLDCIASYRKAIELAPDFAAAHSNLGEALRDHGQIEAAIASYQAALTIDPHLPQAHYSLGVLLYDLGRLDEAIPHLSASRHDDWHDRVLYCLYKGGRIEAFREQLEQRVAAGPHTAPLLATLSAHHAANYHLPDAYTFCPNPLDFVVHGHLDELDTGSSLREALLADIQQAAIVERDQGRLHFGVQSSGNLFRRPEASFRQLGELLRAELRRYRDRFADAQCALITRFPDELDISSSWYVKMAKGGHLDSHIHEGGWVSGVVYLAIPQDDPTPDAGNIEFSTNGDNYPVQHDDWPRKLLDVKVGDYAFFPSSLFHRTIPFDSQEERICIAFDLKPDANANA
ncbi:MAG: tetratricopeptide repeat protein [Betaproteobacteria bacterium]|nr:tetratricopeptide repeat protein [Betaproteobacteria bacterium]